MSLHGRRNEGPLRYTRIVRHLCLRVFDEYRRNESRKADGRKNMNIYEHLDHEKLATDVIECRATCNDMKFSGMCKELPYGR